MIRSQPQAIILNNSEALKFDLLNKIPKALPKDGQMVERVSEDILHLR
jgi:hypothetical protein